MSGVHEGGCLCGAVRFRVTGEFEHFFLCHCARCRHDSGSAFAATLFSGAARLDWLAGREQVRTFRLEGSRHGRAFCGRCGSALPLETEAAGLAVPAGCLDSDPGIAPGAHICWADRAVWEDALEHAPRIAGLPGAE
ncbi:glutathione-dependent formaldehyde-activating protein (plasmid) [Rhodovulum sulfidophilum]|uniref:Glutathione-dependent formaldehyde-activating protein n=1 Tax=Rhodovulum sulfidophilum TaxID=35806 RepID=A0A0D6B9P0_RHOSU|nr:glutathione-dependent formaldehyde-activating protein [Rhodovulum sulfidophilum]